MTTAKTLGSATQLLKGIGIDGAWVERVAASAERGESVAASGEGAGDMGLDLAASALTLAMMDGVATYLKHKEAAIMIGSLVVGLGNTLVAKIRLDSRSGITTHHYSSRHDPLTLFLFEGMPKPTLSRIPVVWQTEALEGGIVYNTLAFKHALAVEAFLSNPKRVMQYLHVPWTVVDSEHAHTQQLVPLHTAAADLKRLLLRAAREMQGGGQGIEGLAESYAKFIVTQTTHAVINKNLEPKPLATPASPLATPASPSPSSPSLFSPMPRVCFILKTPIEEIHEVFPYLEGLSPRLYTLDVTDFWGCDRCSMVSSATQIEPKILVSIPALIATFESGAGLRWNRNQHHPHSPGLAASSTSPSSSASLYLPQAPLSVWGRTPLGATFLKCFFCHVPAHASSATPCLFGCHRMTNWSLDNPQGLFDPQYEARVDTTLMHHTIRTDQVREATRFMETMHRKLQAAIASMHTVCTQEQERRLVDGTKALAHYVHYAARVISHDLLETPTSHYFRRLQETTLLEGAPDSTTLNPFAPLKIDTDKPFYTEIANRLYTTNHSRATQRASLLLASPHSASPHSASPSSASPHSASPLRLVASTPACFTFDLRPGEQFEGEQVENGRWVTETLNWMAATGCAMTEGEIAELARLCREVEIVLDTALSSSCPVCATRYKLAEGCTHVHCPRCGHHHCFVCNKRFPNARQPRSVEDIEAIRREFRITAGHLFDNFAFTPLNRRVMQTCAAAEEAEDEAQRRLIMGRIKARDREAMVRFDGNRFVHGTSRASCAFGMCPLYLSDLASVDIWALEDDESDAEAVCDLYNSKSILRFIYEKNHPTDVAAHPHLILGTMAQHQLGSGHVDADSPEQEAMMIGAGLLLRVSHALFDHIRAKKRRGKARGQQTHGETCWAKVFAVMLFAGLEFAAEKSLTAANVKDATLDPLSFLAYLQIAYTPRSNPDGADEDDEDDDDEDEDEEQRAASKIPDIPLHQALFYTLLEFNHAHLRTLGASDVPDRSQNKHVMMPQVAFASIQSLCIAATATHHATQLPVYLVYDMFSPLKWTP